MQPVLWTVFSKEFIFKNVIKIKTIIHAHTLYIYEVVYKENYTTVIVQYKFIT